VQHNDKEVLAEWERKHKLAVCENLRRMFQNADQDGSGLLTVEELKGSYENPEFRAEIDAFGSLEDLVRLFDLCDLDGGGSLSADEFLDGMMRYEEDRALYLCSRIYELLRIMLRTNKNPGSVGGRTVKST